MCVAALHELLVGWSGRECPTAFLVRCVAVLAGAEFGTGLVWHGPEDRVAAAAAAVPRAELEAYLTRALRVETWEQVKGLVRQPRSVRSTTTTAGAACAVSGVTQLTVSDVSCVVWAVFVRAHPT
jgi:hypothetical protein